MPAVIYNYVIGSHVRDEEVATLVCLNNLKFLCDRSSIMWRQEYFNYEIIDYFQEAVI